MAKVVTSPPEPLWIPAPFTQFPRVPTQANSLTAPWGRVVPCSTSGKWLQESSQNAQVTGDPVGTGQALLSSACQPGELASWWKHMPKDVLKVG